jgi:3-oxoacyl-[acyl-carrier protein] reductase
MELGIAGRRAAVAAASQGLGFAVAHALAAEGASVAICSRDEERITAAARRIGERAVPITADVSSEDGGAAFVAAAQDALGGIDILVTNGGGPPAGTFATTPRGEYRRAVEQSCLSAIAMCSAAVPAMRAGGWGRIVAITSIAVKQPIGDLILSNTARAGLTGFLRTLARELAGSGITVNSVLPGLHDTERLRALGHAPGDGAVGRPDDLGAVVAFLCSEHARYVTGVALQVDGGAYAGLL